MFDRNHLKDAARRRHRDDRFDIGRQIRDELRRNLRHQGPNNPAFNLGELLGGTRRGGALVRRGEVRGLILGALRDRPMHGYEVIQELEAQSGGRWRPSAGSIYPTLQLLADEGLVAGADIDGRRTYTITDAGRKVIADSPVRSPWAQADADDEARGPDIRKLAMQLAAAVIEVHRMGSPAARQEANRILSDARRQMYRLLSEDDDASADDAPVDEAGER